MSPDYQIPGRVPQDGVARQAVSDFWRDRYTREPYYDNTLYFDDYEPAYQIGHAAHAENRAQAIIRAYDEVEHELESRWNADHGKSRLNWAQARNAVRRGWEEASKLDPHVQLNR